MPGVAGINTRPYGRELPARVAASVAPRRPAPPYRPGAVRSQARCWGPDWSWTPTTPARCGTGPEVIPTLSPALSPGPFPSPSPQLSTASCGQPAFPTLVIHRVGHMWQILVDWRDTSPHRPPGPVENLLSHLCHSLW